MNRLTLSLVYATWLPSPAIILTSTRSSSPLGSYCFWSLIGFWLLIGRCSLVVRVPLLSARKGSVGRSWFSVSWFDELPHVSRFAAGVSSQLFSSHTSLAS